MYLQYHRPSIISINLYHLHHSCKLLRMTWPIVDKKTDKFRTFDATDAITIVVVAWVSANKFLNFILHIIKIDMYHLQCCYNLFKITWPIVDRKADEFKIFGAVSAVVVAVALVVWVADDKFINFICQKTFYIIFSAIVNCSK